MAAYWFRFDKSALRPWLAGLVILAALIWGISWLLDTQQLDRTAAEDEAEGTATAATTTAALAGSASNAAPVPLAELLPLGPEDDGFRVIVRGSVVADPIAEGFWILTDEDEVIFARTMQPATSGQDLKLIGTLHQVAAAEGGAWAAEARLREAAGWKVHRNLYLEASTPPGSAAASDTGAAAGSPRDST